MKIEAGKYYRTRDGRIVGPMQEASRDTEKWKFWALGFGEGNPCWTAEGRWSAFYDTHPMNLVSEVYVSDTPPGLTATTITNGLHYAMPETKTLRDEFAMQLMDADAFMVGFKEHAEQLYRAADAMMEARKK